MNFAKIFSAQTSALAAHIVTVEVDLIKKTLHGFTIVGLPDKAVEEARDRVSAAIKNTGFKSPKQRQIKVVIALAPADIKKEGTAFDVAISLGYLLAHQEISFDPSSKLFLGELALDGTIRPINGILPLVHLAAERGFTEVFVPQQNAEEAALIGSITVYGCGHLQDVIGHINTKKIVQDEHTSFSVDQCTTLTEQPQTIVETSFPKTHVDIEDIRGQESAKRGLLIAAAGGHNIALYGPPGTGKTMLAKAFRGLLPALSFEDQLTVTSIHSIAGNLKESIISHPPFRAPHHTSSYVSIAGGGTYPKPGEITLAHHGILFLDEFPEFDRRVIEALREPLEERVISISRAKGSAQFPARFILIAAMNPCPCGNFGTQGKECHCSPLHLDRYRRKLSGPIIDRIDLWVEVAQIDYEKLSADSNGKDLTSTLRTQIASARALQHARFEHLPITLNSEMDAKTLTVFAPLTDDVRIILNQSAEKLNLSARAYHRIIKLARTIADLEKSERIQKEHLLEALQYRPKNNY